jgi:hypothetical protein
MKQKLLTSSPSDLTGYVFVLDFHRALLLTRLLNLSSMHSGFSVAAMFVTGDLTVCIADTIKCETETVSEPLILGAFAKLRKETVSFFVPVCTSVRSHGTTRLPLDEYS